MISPKQLIDEIKPLFKEGLELSEDGQALLVDRGNIKNVLEAVKERQAGAMLLDITAVDYAEYFELVYHVMASDNAGLLRVKMKVPRNDTKVPSVEGIWKSADVLEREIFDLMGIGFEGHGNLKRILCSDDFVGNPLRKDFKLDIISRF